MIISDFLSTLVAVVVVGGLVGSQGGMPNTRVAVLAAITPRRFPLDTRAGWIVQDGEIRFTIEGQEPFVATQGFMAQVPCCNVYRLETIGASEGASLSFSSAIFQIRHQGIPDTVHHGE